MIFAGLRLRVLSAAGLTGQLPEISHTHRRLPKTIILPNPILREELTYEAPRACTAELQNRIASPIKRGISSIMTINGHLLLLVVAAGLFTRLWSTNDRPRPPAVWRTPSRAVSTMPPPQPVAADCDIPLHTVSTTKSAEATHEEVWTAANCPIPLPAGMDAGTFRVVDDTGRVARLVLTSPVPAVDADALPGSDDIQTLTVDSRRWYFIRLQSPVARTILDCKMEVGAIAPIAPLDADPIRTACANRKFDFTGFETPTNFNAAPVNAAPLTEDFRPESPALPVTE